MLTVLYKSASRTPHRRAPGETGSAAGRCGGLQRRGAPIGATDTLIAAHARSQAAALVNSAARRCERGAGPAACRLGVNARHSPGRVRGGGQTRTDAVARKGTRGDPRVRGRRNIATIPEVTLGGAAMAAAFSDKQTILETLQSLPEDATIEDAIERGGMRSSRLRPDRFAGGS